MLKDNRFTILGLILGALLPTLVLGAETDHGNVAEHSGEAHHKNVFGIFVGLSSQDRRDGVTLGIEYERRFGPQFGIGVSAESALGEIDTDVYVLSFAYHSESWKTYIGPGIENSHAGSEGIVRIGSEYAFELGNWEVAPQISIDFAEADQVAYIGVVFSYGF